MQHFDFFEILIGGVRKDMFKSGIHILLMLCALCFLTTTMLGQGFETEISAFEQADLASPPPENPVLFVGSSSIRIWPDLVGDFPDYPVINRGFGGSQMSDVLYYLDRVVAVYDPALIVVYEGDNDLASGKSVDQVYADYIEFLALVEEQLPGADVAFISTKPSPSRSQYLEVTRQLNARLEELASNDYHLWFIDVFTPMLDDSGQPRPELFGSDMLHMNSAGYELWKSIIEPVLAAWAMPKVQTLLFDFGSSNTPTQNGPDPDDPLNFWNNVTEAVGSVDGGQMTKLVNTQNIETTIGLEIMSRFNGANTNGTVESAVFAPNATRDSLYGNTETWNSLTDITPSFKLTGLDPQRVYNITFYASRLGVSDIRETSYTIEGEGITVVVFDPANKIDGVVTAMGIVPNAMNEITISLAPTENNNNGYHFTYLGVMKVEEIPEQQPIIFLEQPASQTVMAYHTATFQTTVQSTPPYTIQWFKDGEPIADVNEFAYTIDIVTPDMNDAVFSVSVSNLIYSGMSEDAVLHVVPDNNSPVLLSAESTNGHSIVLSFDERLSSDTASVIENYSVNEGAVEVVGAELDVDTRIVILTLGEYILDSFNVSVSFVQDLAGNEIAAGTTVAGYVHLEALLFDFGSSDTPTSNDPNNAWNNVTQSVGCSDTGRLAALVDMENVQTNIGLVMIRRFNGANTNGNLASTVFPQEATRDSLFGNTESFSGLANVFPSFKLTGLDSLLEYDFTFYASRMSVGDNRETGYTITGANSGFGALNPVVNVEKVVMVTGIKPDVAGEITIDLAPTENNVNSYHFTYLGAMKVETKPPAN
jgi:lysophospholipase L1-like esterase